MAFVAPLASADSTGPLTCRLGITCTYFHISGGNVHSPDPSQQDCENASKGHGVADSFLHQVDLCRDSQSRLSRNRSSPQTEDSREPAGERQDRAHLGATCRSAFRAGTARSGLDETRYDQRSSPRGGVCVSMEM